MSDCREVTGLDTRSVINASWNAVSDQIHKKRFLPFWWRFEQLNHVRSLFGGQRQRRNAKSGPFGNVITVS